MKTLVISDTSFLSNSYYELKENIYYVKRLQKEGYQIIILSNEPNNLAHGFLVNDQNPDLIHMKNHQQTTNNFEFSFQSENERISINYDYLIVGHGISIQNDQKEEIFLGEPLNKNYLRKIRNLLSTMGYKEEQRTNPKIIPFYEDTFKYLTSTEKSKVETNSVYGISCTMRNAYFDNLLTENMVRLVPSMLPFEFQNEIYFIYENSNLLEAISFLHSKQLIDINNTLFILRNFTEQCIADVYIGQTIALSYDIHLTNLDWRENSLSRVLDRIDKYF